jgi:hypothetical protein
LKKYTEKVKKKTPDHQYPIIRNDSKPKEKHPTGKTKGKTTAPCISWQVPQKPIANVICIGQ